MTSPLDMPGHVRITVEGSDPALVDRAVRQLAALWQASGPEPMASSRTAVWLYARPDHPADDDGPDDV